MNSSLRDQLLAAGLVTEKQARQAAQEQQRQARKQHANQHGRQAQQQPQRPAQGQQPQRQAQAQPQPQPQPAQRASQPPSVTVQAQQAQAAKVARDLELNRKREEKAQRKARIAQIEQIIEQHRLPRLETDDHYSFIDGKKIRRMSVDAERRERLTKRELAIVRYRGHYAVVPADIAERVRERDENMVVPLVEPTTQASSEVDDAYKDYVVPDDLMW